MVPDQLGHHRAHPNWPHLLKTTMTLSVSTWPVNPHSSLVLECGREGRAGREDTNKSTGAENQVEAQMRSEPGEGELDGPSAVGQGTSWPHLFAKDLGRG